MCLQQAETLLTICNKLESEERFEEQVRVFTNPEDNFKHDTNLKNYIHQCVLVFY